MKVSGKKCLLLLLLLKTACSSSSQTEMSEVHASYVNIQENLLSSNQMLEDLDVILDSMKAYFPFLGVAYRRFEIDIMEKSHRLVDILQQLEDDERWTIPQFHWWLWDQLFNPFESVGHLRLFAPGYHHYEQLWRNRVHDFENEPNFISDTMDDLGVAYIKINSFHVPDLEMLRNLADIRDFYHKINQYEHLIIDLTRNEGGIFATYFSELFQPLMNEGHEMEVRGLVVDPAHPHLASRNWISSTALLPERAPHTERLAYGFLSSFRYGGRRHYQVIDGRAVRTGEESIFSGRLWVLISETTASAAEHMARIVKDAGIATLVGQPTRGVSGIPPYIVRHREQTPHSGLTFTFDLINFVDAYGRSFEEYTLQPHLFSDDPLQTVLDYISEQSARLAKLKNRPFQ